MNFIDVLRTLFEIVLVITVVWGLFHEDKFVAFERRIIAKLRRRGFKVIRGGNSVRSTRMPSYAALERNA